MAHVFFSYSHADEELRNELEKHLAGLLRQGVITTWHDRRIGPGEELHGQIDEQLNAADIVLLLVSADFLASDYCHDVEQPEVLNTGKAPTYAAAIAEFKAEGKCPDETRHRQVKYLNNVVEADHGKLKLLLRPVRGFKTLKTAYATIKGFEVMRALRKGQAGIFALQAGIVGEARIVERAFGLGPCALTEVMALLQNRLANAEA